MLRQQLAQAFLTTESFKYDPDQGFTLTSGLRSPFYVDCRTLMAHPSARRLVGQMAFGLLKDLAFDCLGGMELGAVAIATSISDYGYAATPRREWRTFIVRKAQKEHGLGRLIEGAVRPGDRALIVDDVLTSGGSVLNAIQAARAAGLTVTHALVLVDRKEQDGSTRVAEQGVTLLTLLSIDDLRAAQAG